MDDVNINEICLEEIEVTADGDEWIKLNWINKQNDDNHETCQSLDVEEEDSNTETAQQMNDNDNKVLCVNAEPEDISDGISDGISVITESDTDTVNTNNLQICRFTGKTYRPLQMLEMQINKQANIRNALACIIGIIIGFILSHSFIAISAVYPNSNEINTESLKTVSHNIINTCKALAEVKTMLNEIKARSAVDKEIMEHFIGQLFKIDSVHKMNDKPTSESFNFDPYSLDQVFQLQVSLHVLSSLSSIYNNNSLKNEISETLDIVNSTKTFYENLILFNNSTQNEYNSFALKTLQRDSDKIHITSKLLLSNLMEKMSKITLNVHDKYTKEKHKLIKKLCDLKNVLPDDEFLKELTENNELFKNYDKSCFSNYLSKELNTKTFGKKYKHIKIKNVKKKTKETDDTIVYAKYNKKNSQKISDNDIKNSLKNDKIKTLNEYNYAITKFFQNANDKIHNTIQLLPSNSIEKMSREMLNKQLWKDSLSTNSCPRFNIDVPSSCKTENCIVNSNNKHDANSKESVLDYESSVKILFEKSGPKQKDYSKSRDSTKKIFNNDDKNIKGKKKTFPQNKLKNHMTEHTVNYHKSKQSSFNSRVTKQNNQDYKNIDWQSNNERFHKKQWQRSASDWYFQRAFARRKARRYAEYLYQRNTKWSWKYR